MLKRSPGGGLPTERSFGLFFGFLFLATALWFFFVRPAHRRRYRAASADLPRWKLSPE